MQVAAQMALPAFADGAFDAVVFGCDPLNAVHGAQRSVIDDNKRRLVRRIASQRWQAETVLVWHVGMLKLLPLLRGFRGKVVLFCHGIELWKPHSWFTRRLLRRVDLFLSNSDYTWGRFLEYAPFLRGRPQITTALGFGEPITTASPLAEAVPSAAIVARMAKGEDYKGHRELIEAWPSVLTRVPNARLDVIGDGDLRPELEALAREKSVSSHVCFRGRVSEERKADLLAASRCLAMPSRGEGFGLVYLEAMRLGRPCLVSDCDAGLEVVNPPEAGLAVGTGDLQGLVDALARLLSDGGEWRRWSAAGRARYERLFTAARFRTRLVDGITRVESCELGRLR